MAEEQVKSTGKKTKRSLWSRVWNGLFRLHGDDVERRLRYISKQEATLLARMNKRSSCWRATARNLIVISAFLEVVAVGYAIITTRSVDLEWQTRALRVLPIFLLPVASSAFYFALLSFTRLCDSWDQNTLESLRAERQEKIDELKERTNYYTTQQLIQKYDPDPAAKAAAAAVLASKLGADSGLKVLLGDEYYESIGKSHDFEPTKSCGLRKRNTLDSTPKGGNSFQRSHFDMEMINDENEPSEVCSAHKQIVVEHHNPAAYGSQDGGGWLARVAALLVGEDPSQSYALICGNCHMHNGLARKEDFPYITYFCPRCHALNRPRSSGVNSPGTSNQSPTSEDAAAELLKQSIMNTSRKASASNSPVGENENENENENEASDKIVANHPAASQ